MSMRAGSLRNTGQLSFGFLTSVARAPTTCPAPTSSAEASPARTSAAQGSGRASRGKGRGSGKSLPASFASFDPATSSWRTLPRSGPGDSMSFSGTWPRAGSMRNGIASRRQPLAPITAGTDCSLWPTPRAGPNENRQTKPTTSQLAGTHGMSLGVAVRMFPTPTARDWRSGKSSMATQQRNSRPLSEVAAQGQVSGQLNPTWVEWLMGFPLGWTDCGGPATRSSRKSRSSSGG